MAAGEAAEVGGTGEGVPPSPRAGTWAGRGGALLHLGGAAGTRHLLGFLAAPAPDACPGAAAAAGAGAPGAPLHPRRLCGGDAGGGIGHRAPPQPPARGAQHHRGVPRRGGSIRPPVPGQPRLTPARPGQAIFTSAASVIAIKLTKCRRLCVGAGGAAARQRPRGTPRATGASRGAGGASSRRPGGRWVLAGVLGSLPGQGPALHGRRSTALPLHLSSLSAATSRALTQRRARVWVPLLPQALREQGLQEDQCDQ